MLRCNLWAISTASKFLLNSSFTWSNIGHIAPPVVVYYINAWSLQKVDTFGRGTRTRIWNDAVKVRSVTITLYLNRTLVPPPGIDPGSLVLQTSVITLSTKAAIQVIGGEYRTRTDQAICLQSKSGYPAHPPLFILPYRNILPADFSLPIGCKYVFIWWSTA